MNGHCENCKTGTHCDGKGMFDLFSHDGKHSYICQCLCAMIYRTKENAAYALGPLIRRYGRELLLEVLMNDKRK